MGGLAGRLRHVEHDEAIAVTTLGAIERIDPQQRYTVISTDYQQLYRAVIADNLRPEPMP